MWEEISRDKSRQAVPRSAEQPLRIAHGGFRAKKISATRKLHLSIKPLLQIHITFASQEIVRCPTSYIWLSPSWGWLKLQNHKSKLIRHHKVCLKPDNKSKKQSQHTYILARAVNDHQSWQNRQISIIKDQNIWKYINFIWVKNYRSSTLIRAHI